METKHEICSYMEVHKYKKGVSVILHMMESRHWKAIEAVEEL